MASNKCPEDYKQDMRDGFIDGGCGELLSDIFGKSMYLLLFVVLSLMNG